MEEQAGNLDSGSSGANFFCENRPSNTNELSSEGGGPQLCAICSQMTLESLTRPLGFKNDASFDEIRQKAIQCRFCSIIEEVLGQGRWKLSEDGPEGPFFITATCQDNEPIETIQIRTSSEVHKDPRACSSVVIFTTDGGYTRLVHLCGKYSR